MKTLAYALVTLLWLSMTSSSAHAQYRNQLFSLGGGTHRIIGDNPNLQIGSAFMLGGEYLWRMLDNHWWFGLKVNIGFRKHLDPFADNVFGTFLESKPGIFLRYVILTDDIRPYVQLGSSFSSLWFFKDAGEQAMANYLPHSNWGSLSLGLGLEYVYARNMSFSLSAEGEWMFIWSSPDSRGIHLTALLNFYL